MREGHCIGIAAYNEAANIGRLLDRLLSHGPEASGPSEIIVVASGCTDDTEAIVRDRARTDRRIKLVSEPVRRGKASAVNIFIGRANHELLVLMSADILPEGEAMARLLEPFSDTSVGVTAGRIVPENDPRTFMGCYVNLFWRLHHLVALEGFKAGEVVAFRRVIGEIPSDTATDETWIARLVMEKGYKARYAPDAVFLNRGPDNFRDFLKVRRRHLIGYHHLKRLRPDWALPDTMDNRRVVGHMLRDTSLSNINIAYVAGAVLLEILARLLAWHDFRVAGRNPFVWDTAASTKKLAGDR